MTFQIVLLLGAFLCSLVAGLLLAFATVVMPGIGKLDDAGFLRAFQAIDGVIQKNQPVFLFVWIGSALAVIAAAALGVRELAGASRLLVVAAALIYLGGVQLPTAAISIPMNNAIQKLDPGAISETARKNARNGFEGRWNRWNIIRTVCACIASVLLLILVLLL